ncbi:LysR family transcriptional regulator [Microvirga roseola]|uniref:LysR family transcriptional regulator n=1 Tax=Microvirga roseola TaxID=2883126 RepID=UPI001E53BBE8|nr:LysR substrate-binding domain-containing protein [Microvirga roseola]
MQQSALRYFLEVARTGSVSAAADRLHVAASAVSRQISKLEEELGSPLFERRSRGMTLTHAGRLLESYAQRATLESDQIVSEIRELNSATRGHIRLGVTEGLAVSFIPEMIHAFRTERPQVLFDLKVLAPGDVVRSVQDGEVDIGISFSLSPDGGVKVQWQQPMLAYAIASPDHPLVGRGPVSTTELFEYPIAILDDATTIKKVLDIFCATKGITLAPVVSSTNIASLLSFCRLGGAITFSTYISVRRAVRDGHIAIVPLKETSFLKRNLQIQTMLGRTLPQSAQDFIAFVVSELRRPEAIRPPLA